MREFTPTHYFLFKKGPAPVSASPPNGASPQGLSELVEELRRRTHAPKTTGAHTLSEAERLLLVCFPPQIRILLFQLFCRLYLGFVYF